MAHISPHAIVEEGAELADDVRVGAFSYIGPRVKIAAGCVIENNASIVGTTTLGESNHVFPMGVVGVSSAEGAGEAGCVLGEANSIREHVTLYAGSDVPTRVGNDNLIMIGSQLGSGAALGDHGVFANFTRIGAGARIGDYVVTSGFATVGDGVSVGAYTFVSGYAGIDSDVPPYAMVQGFPLRVRGVNTTNLRRCGFGDDDIRVLKEAFRELFNGADLVADLDAIESFPEALKTNLHIVRLIEAVRRSGIRPKESADE